MSPPAVALDSVLVLGASSDIAMATVRELVGRATTSLVLCARDTERLAPLRDELTSRGVEVSITGFDADDPDSHPELVDRVFAQAGHVDLAVLAFGVLPRPESALDRDAALGALATNAAGGISLLAPVAERMKRQGHGVVVVLSSVAALMPRGERAGYAASKAALDAFAVGLADDLSGSGVDVMVVRPGFVRTRMTAGLAPAPFATSPEDVASAIVRGLRRRPTTMWVPRGLGPMVALLRLMPRRLVRRLSG